MTLQPQPRQLQRRAAPDREGDRDSICGCEQVKEVNECIAMVPSPTSNIRRPAGDHSIHTKPEHHGFNPLPVLSCLKIIYLARQAYHQSILLERAERLMKQLQINQPQRCSRYRHWYRISSQKVVPHLSFQTSWGASAIEPLKPP